MSIELFRILILFALSSVALSIAINAKKPIKMTVSFLIAISAFGLAGWVTSANWSLVKGTQEADELMIQNMQIEDLPADPVTGVTSVRIVEEKGPKIDRIAVNSFMKEGKYWVIRGEYWAKKVTELKVGNLVKLSDDEYEELSGEARSLRYKTASIYQKIKDMKSGSPKTKEMKKEILLAGKALSLAGTKLHRYFNAESEDEEAILVKEYKKFAQIAEKKFRALKKSYP
ncbi:MAG: hypothetical protein OCD01_16970 [Fibrobacterales bacterium]